MIQVRLWTDCYNNCSFCSMGVKSITKVEDKRERINKTNQLKYSRIGLIGGEFFEGQLKGVEEEWLNMVKTIGCNELFITANLINDQYLLKETLETRPDILICTSYDTVGRFKNDEQKYVWLDRVNSLKNVFCTIIPTEDIINDPFIDNIKCGISFSEPFLGTNWLKTVDKSNYHENLIKENKIFNLPKRNHLLKWLLKHPTTIHLIKNYKNNHFTNILSFDANNNFIYECDDRFNDNNFMAECGHPHFSKLYADSDKCMVCDIEEIY